MGRSDYHPVLNIYYYIVTGYEPIGFGPLPNRNPIAKILRGGRGASKALRLMVKTIVPPVRTFLIRAANGRRGWSAEKSWMMSRRNMCCHCFALLEETDAKVHTAVTKDYAVL